jgi:hypothetical protein
LKRKVYLAADVLIFDILGTKVGEERAPCGQNCLLEKGPAEKLVESSERIHLPPVMLEMGWDAKCEIRMRVSMVPYIPRSLHATKCHAGHHGANFAAVQP